MRAHLIVAVLGFLVLLPACDFTKTSARRASTVSRLKNAYYVMAVIESERNETIARQLQEITNQANLRNKWVQMMTNTANASGIDPKVAFEQWCHDGYGNLFNVDFRTNLILHGAPGTLTDADFDIVVWSSGSNGTNEFGNGDDVIPSRPPMQGSSDQRIHTQAGQSFNRPFYDRVIREVQNGQIKTGEEKGVRIAQGAVRLTCSAQLPPDLRNASVGGEIYVARPSTNQLLVVFKTWRGKGFNMKGYLYASKALSPAEITKDYYGRSVVVIGPVELGLEKQLAPNWYRVSYKLD